MAGWVPLEIEQYTTFIRTLTIKAADGTPQNLTGYTANTLLRKSYYSTTANVVTTTISSPSNGEITLSMTAANTGNLTPGRYVYDVVSTAGDGAKTRLIEGIVVVSPGVTY